MDRFERQVDPEGILDPAERAIRAESAKKAFYSRMALASARARRLRRQADEIEAGTTEELARLGESVA